MIVYLLNKIDFYGSSYQFTIFKNQKYHTTFGAVVSIFTIVGYIICFWYFGKEFYNRQNPNLLHQTTNLPDYPFYSINKNDLMIAYRIEDFDSNYIDINGLLEIEIVYRNYINVGGKFILNFTSEMETITCMEVDTIAMRLKSNKDLSQTKCIKFDNTSLGGYWDGEFLNYISIYFKSCINSTQNNFSCIPRETANKILTSGLISFNVYTGMYYTELTDYDNPLKLYNYNVYAVVEPKIGKNIMLNFKKGSIKTDMGYITEKSDNYSLIGLDSVKLDTFPINPPFDSINNSTSIAMFEIYVGKNVETFDIKYVKLQEIIANIGGFLSITTFLLTYITNFVNEHYMMNELINYLFDFSDLKEINKLTNLLKKKYISKKEILEFVNFNVKDKKMYSNRKSLSYLVKSRKINIVEDDNQKNFKKVFDMDTQINGSFFFK
jgi:hypothetical protein